MREEDVFLPRRRKRSMETVDLLRGTWAQTRTYGVVSESSLAFRFPVSLCPVSVSISLQRGLQRTSTPNGKVVSILRGQYALHPPKSRLWKERERERVCLEASLLVNFLFFFNRNSLFLLFWLTG